jgi:hypothetical protein
MQTNEPEVSEIHLAYIEGHKDGRKVKTEEILKWAKNRICFDNRDNGVCDHAACYELQNLVEMLNSL